MITLLQKAALIGLGVAQQTKETLDDLLKRGEENQSEEAKKVRAFFASSAQVEAECRQKTADLCTRITQSIRIPSQSDIERLENRIADLTEQVQSLRNQKGNVPCEQDHA